MIIRFFELKADGSQITIQANEKLEYLPRIGEKVTMYNIEAMQQKKYLVKDISHILETLLLIEKPINYRIDIEVEEVNLH